MPIVSVILPTYNRKKLLGRSAQSVLNQTYQDFELIIIDPDGRLLVCHTREDYLPIVERYGYSLLAKEPKYRDPAVQRYGVSPTYHYLFELSSRS